MPVSLDVAKHHVETWTRKLSPYPGRKSWPGLLFHCCQLEVAVAIIREGSLRCRSSVGIPICDVANQGALWNNPNAHDFVRLYFRPKTLFHFKTEGIKPRTDPHRHDPHMSIPVMFAFNLETVITRADAKFSDMNLAKDQALIKSDDNDFLSLPFDKIYHDGPTNPMNRPTIHSARMAEVIVEGDLPLGALSAIVCRTIHEKRTLIQMLGVDAEKYSIVVEKNDSVFMKRAIFVKEIYCSEGIVHITTTTPIDSNWVNIQYRLCSDEANSSGILPSSRVTLSNLVAKNADTIWTLEIDGCLAYQAAIPWSAGIV